jgi:uncharacterized protein
MDTSPKSSARKVISLAVDLRWVLVLAAVIVTAVLGYFAPGMTPDPTMKSGISTTAPEYIQYQKFLADFGNEEFVLVAIKTPPNSDGLKLLQSLDAMTRALERIENIEEVTSLANLSFFQKRDGRFGKFPLIHKRNGQPQFPKRQDLDKLRKALPVLDLLVSPDLSTVSVILKIRECCRLDPSLIDKVLQKVTTVFEADLPEGTEFRIIGQPVIRHAIQKYNVQTAIMFGLLCTLISTIISIYIFKSFRVAAITSTVVGMCVVWIIGLMALLDIGLNSTTGLSFGLVLIVSVAAVIHITTHYNEQYLHVRDRVEAAKRALMVVGRPCLMCSLTTATGFASIMISSIPMVRQLGMIMSLGVLISYILAIVLTPALLILLKPPSDKAFDRMSTDWVSTVFFRLERFVFTHYRICAVLGLLLMCALLAGAPSIRSDTQILRMLSDRTKEVADLSFVEDNLAPIHSLELVVKDKEGAFKTPAAWADIARIERSLKQIPEVAATDSFLHVLQYLSGVVAAPDTGTGLFTNPRLIPNLLAITSFSSGGKELLSRYVTDGYGKARISIRIVNSPSTPIGKTIEQIRSSAASALGTNQQLVLTGELAVFAAQAKDLVRAQVFSLLLALGCITVLMILQFRSFLLGMLSLIPNVLPLCVIFGFMGWFGISLDSVTVFAATVSIGLSVDDTIHYLTQLRREIRSAAPGTDIQECLAKAYGITAKALISTSAVLFFGFLMLVISPFRPVIFFGVLGSSAVLAALIADLVFMPSVILSFPFVKRLVNREMKRQATSG